MIDVIIVDDEYIIRERLKKCVNWEDLGYKVVGDCENGLQAIELIDSKRPKLAIVDINMPIMDGLALANYIAKNFLNVYVIILTGYADFNYACDALKNGVFRYLLKPINKEELNAVLVELRDVVRRESDLYKENMIKNHKLDIAKKKDRSQELLEYLTNPMGPIPLDAMKGIKCLDAGLSYTCYTSIISINHFEKIAKDKNLWFFSLENILVERLGNPLEILCTNDLEGRLITCLFCSNDLVQPKELIELLEKYLKTVQELLPFTVTIGMSSRCNHLDQLPNAYKEAKLALANKLVVGSGKVIQYCEYGYQDGNGIDISLLNEFVLNVRVGDSQKVEELLTKVIKGLEKSESWYTSLHNLVSMTMLVTEIICNENHIHYYSVWAQGVTSLEIISESETLDELLAFLIEKLNVLILTIKNISDKKTSSIITQVIKYIELNLTNPDLSLNKICIDIPSNVSYISNQFKKETGININAYITNKRMEEAQRLILQGGLSVEDIAFKVGYNDQYYFSRCYKKHFGIAPSRTGY
ncbi:MAG: response regulator [Vallitaleaceae bacterium]|nr:response regulator [Vallitaleaceae bacterium]